MAVVVLLGGLVGCILIPLMVVFVRWTVNRWRYRRVPGPFAPPIFGNLADVKKHGLHEYMDMCRRKYGRLFKFYIGSKMFIVAADPRVARKVLYKLINHNAASPLTGDRSVKVNMKSLFAVRDNEWRALRMAWQPAFSSSSLEGYTSLMDGCATKLCDVLASREGEAVDLWREVGRMTMSVVGTCAYGVDFHTLDGGADAGGEGGKLVEACRLVFGTGMMGGSIWNRALLLFPGARAPVQWLAARIPDKPLREFTQARATICSASKGLIRQWRDARPSPGASLQHEGECLAAAGKLPSGRSASAGSAGDGDDSSDNESDGAARDQGLEALRPSTPDSEDGAVTTVTAEITAPAAEAAAQGPKKVAAGVAPGSFLDLLLSESRKSRHGGFDDETVMAQSNTFILAGYETTANTLAYTLWAVSAHPRVQERALAEVDAFGRGRRVTYSDISSEDAFPYLRATMKEAMRLYPAASLTHREVTKEEGFDLAPGVRVAQGENIYTSSYCYQRDEEYWPKALEFWPERFLPEGSALAPSLPVETVLTPFGGGARLCIGYRFAQQEVLVTLIRLLQRFTFELQPGMIPLKLEHKLTLSPRDGVVARVVARA